MNVAVVTTTMNVSTPNNKVVELEKVYGPLIGKLGHKKKVKWATRNNTMWFFFTF